MRNRALTIWFLLATALVGQEEPVSMRVTSPATAEAGATFMVKVTVTIDAPYHIYGMASGQPMPTAFSVSGKAGTIVGDPKPDRIPESHVEYDYWEGEIGFQVPVKLDPSAAGRVKLELGMDFMACTDRGCLPPAQLVEQFTIAVKGADAAGEPVGAAPPVALRGGGEDSYPVTIRDHEVGEVAKGRFDVSVAVVITAPYHIYGLTEENVHATSFSVEENADDHSGRFLVLEENVRSSRKPEFHADPGDSENSYHYWKGEVTFDVPLGIGDAQAGETLSFTLIVDVQACNETGCLLPHQLELPVSVAVGDGGAGNGWAADDEGEDPGDEESAPDKVSARLDDDAVPGREVDLLIPLPAGSAEAGDTVGKRKVLLFASHLTVEGDGKVEESSDGLLLRVPVKVDPNKIDQADISLEGTVVLADGLVPFAFSGVARQPMFAFVILAMGAALLALLTPCVFPMIPITISFFTKQGETSNVRPVVMGGTYAAGIILSFVVIGVIFTIALGGHGAVRFAQSPWTLGAIATLFIVFALSLFGMFELQLPASVMNLIGKAQGRGGLVGVWLLGLLFAITTFTCTAPFVGAILASAAASGQWLRPVVGMTAFSAVLAIPFFFLSVFPSRLKSLPRAGSWMNEVKVVMGFVELAAAFKFLGDMDATVFTRYGVLCAWIVIFGACGLYLLGVFRLPHDGPKEKIGVVALTIALLCTGFSVYLTKGLDGSQLHAQVDAYLPREEEGRSPQDRRDALLKELKANGLSGVGGAAKGLQGRVGYRADTIFKNGYEDARAEATRLGAALFIDFTGYA